MRRRRIPGVMDVFEVSDAGEIETLQNDPRMDRKFETKTCPMNRLILERSLKVLSYGGRRFPTMLARDDAERARRQQELWNRLSGQAGAIRSGPEELEALANWVRGVGADEELGMLVQQLLGRLFTSEFQATERSWSAARTLVAAPRSSNPAKLAWWSISGKVSRAKGLLAGMVSGDLSGVNAIGIAAHNVVKSLRHMRVLYANAAARSRMTAEVAAEGCLFAPVSIYRQASAAGEFLGRAYERNSLFVLAIGEASEQQGGRPLVFMEESWSRCPANVWVPAMLEGVWRRACEERG